MRSLRALIGAVATAAALSLPGPDPASARCGAPGEATPFKAQNADRRQVGQDLDEIVERGFIEFAVYDDFPPWSYAERGKAAGLDVAIGRIVAEALGVEARFTLVQAGETVDADLRNHVWRGPVVGGRVANVMLHAPWHPDFACRNELVVLTGQYFTEVVGVAYRDGAYPDGAPTAPYFRFDAVAVENDSLADFYLSGFMGGALMANIRRFPTVADAMAALRDGEVNAVMGPLAQLEWGLRDADGARVAGLSAAAPPLAGLATGQWTIGAAVRHTYRALGYAVDDAIRAAMDDGRIPELFAAHGLTWREPAF
jgi:ABC-type amino acid transport substrate-binding protein